MTIKRRWLIKPRKPKCKHPVTTHYNDVNEVYCHDCRAIIGTGIPQTYKRNSTI